MGPKKVVILGGGFGGIHTLLNLRGLIRRGIVEVTLVSQEDHFLFTPLLHEVVSGKVRRESVGISLPEFLSSTGAWFLPAEVGFVDLSAKKMQTSASILDYDILVISLGARVNYFGIPGAENLPALKSLADAERVKGILSGLLGAYRVNARIVIIGGGATGVELAAEIADLFGEKGEVVLLEALEDILPHTHPGLKGIARKSLERRGVQILTKSPVTRVGSDFIEVGGLAKINCDLAIWTAGVKAVDLALVPLVPKTKSGRLKVLPTLQLPDYPEVFALGDIAEGFPMTAQVAVTQAKVVAQNIHALIEGRSLNRYVYKPAGMLFSLGRWMAGAEVKTYLLNKALYFWGLPAFWFWHLVYLGKIPGRENKLRLLKDWLGHLLRRK